MTAPSQAPVTEMLSALESGDPQVARRLFEAVYGELCKLAHRQRRDWSGDLTLNTTALVHEAYLKMAGGNGSWNNRAHFMAVAARAMRQLLVDYARGRRAEKRGGSAQKVSLDLIGEGVQGDFALKDEDVQSLLDLDEALKRLEMISERQRQVVECRFFGGMSIAETASAVGIGEATVTSDWRHACKWLHRELVQSGA